MLESNERKSSHACSDAIQPSLYSLAGKSTNSPLPDLNGIRFGRIYRSPAQGVAARLNLITNVPEREAPIVLRCQAKQRSRQTYALWVIDEKGET